MAQMHEKDHGFHPSQRGEMPLTEALREARMEEEARELERLVQLCEDVASGALEGAALGGAIEEVKEEVAKLQAMGLDEEAAQLSDLLHQEHSMLSDPCGLSPSPMETVLMHDVRRIRRSFCPACNLLLLTFNEAKMNLAEATIAQALAKVLTIGSIEAVVLARQEGTESNSAIWQAQLAAHGFKHQIVDIHRHSWTRLMIYARSEATLELKEVFGCEERQGG